MCGPTETLVIEEHPKEEFIPYMDPSDSLRSIRRRGTNGMLWMQNRYSEKSFRSSLRSHRSRLIDDFTQQHDYPKEFSITIESQHDSKDKL